MKDKRKSRLRRALRIRSKIRRDGETRLSVHRTGKHMYAQIIEAESANVIASASTLDAVVKKEVSNGGNIAAAAAVGKRIAELAKEKGVERLVFDRSGFRYHGRVKALAEAAREAGLKI